jgi:4-hydroxy-tetrahydrodipicolinate reductase
MIMTDICLVGGLGRMGRALAAGLAGEDDLRLVSVWETAERMEGRPDYGAETGYRDNQVLVTADGRKAVEMCHVVVDFSLASAFDDVVNACGEASKPLVSGTTAVEDKEVRLKGLVGKVAVVNAPNMAVGMNLLFDLCRHLAAVLDSDWDVEIVESHHRTKLDVPSGTALALARSLKQSSDRRVVIGRSEEGRKGDEIVIHSLRAGDVPGKHNLVLAGPGETIEIGHTAFSRACFASGALKAARFASGAPPGLYDMADVLRKR